MLARTDMRIGEALALQWDDINFQERYIHIQRGLSRGIISYPKSGKDRKVDMSSQLTDTLKRLKGNFTLKVVTDMVWSAKMPMLAFTWGVNFFDTEAQEDNINIEPNITNIRVINPFMLVLRIFQIVKLR